LVSLEELAITGNLDAQARLGESDLFDQVLTKPVGLNTLRTCLEKTITERS
jgi:hypothetical protein